MYEDPARFEQEEPEQSDLCHPGKVEYRATMGAPGRGQAWECTTCGKEYVKIGATYIDPTEVPDGEEPPWILTLEDVR